MKKILVISTILLVALAITFSIKMFEKKDQESLSLDRSSAYLEDPESYMEELNEDSHFYHQEHDSHGKPPEYYESLKNELIQKDTLVLTDTNYTSLMYVIDKYYESFEGKQIELMGFIYREQGFLENQFVIGRRGVENEEAIYGVLSTSPKSKELANNQWVKVSGTLSKTKYFADEVAYLLVEEVIEVEPPKDPYVYEPE